MAAHPGLLYVCSTGFFFFSIATFASQLLFGLASPGRAVASAFAGTAVLLACSGALSLSGATSLAGAAAVGFAAGSAVFAVLAVASGDRAFSDVDFTCYRGTLSRGRRWGARAEELNPYRAGRGHPATQTPRRDLRLFATVAAVGMLASVTYLTTWPSPVPPRPLPSGVSRLHSGLLVADPLDKVVGLGQLQDQYVLDGSAGPRLGWVSETKGGLAVGIKAHRGWAGWFASTIHAAGPAVAWHTVISPTALRLGTKGQGIAVFAVQTATTQKNGVINYIVVAAVCRSGSYRWLIGNAHGLVARASTQVLWASKWQAVPQHGTALPSQAVTVVTDGSHSLSVWFGTDEIFSSERLVLDMPAPFQAYLEVQSSAAAYYARGSTTSGLQTMHPWCCEGCRKARGSS